MLDRGAVELLFAILENSVPVISGEILQDYYPQAGSALLKAGLLVPDGYEPVATATEDHADGPVTVKQSDDDSALGYFSNTAGWVPVDPSRLLRHRIDMAALTRALVPLDTILVPRSPIPVLEDHLWDLGRIEIARRSVSIWLGRRVYDPAVWGRIRTMLRQRPPAYLRILLTSTPADRIPEERSDGSLLFSAADLMGPGDIRIDAMVLAARLAGDLRLGGSEPLYLSPDGRRLVIAGSVTISFDSDKQRAVIQRLVDGYARGERFPARQLLEDAGLSTTSLQRAFGRTKWKQLRRYLTTRSGLWGFEI